MLVQDPVELVLSMPEEERRAWLRSLAPDDAVAQAPIWLQQGIAAITFDHGVSGYFAPLGNLPPIRAHVRGEA